MNDLNVRFCRTFELFNWPVFAFRIAFCTAVAKFTSQSNVISNMWRWINFEVLRIREDSTWTVINRVIWRIKMMMKILLLSCSNDEAEVSKNDNALWKLIIYFVNCLIKSCCADAFSISSYVFSFDAWYCLAHNNKTCFFSKNLRSSWTIDDETLLLNKFCDFVFNEDKRSLLFLYFCIRFPRGGILIDR